MGKFDCENGGICVNNSDAGICQCQSEFTGTYCETLREENRFNLNSILNINTKKVVTSTSMVKYIQTNNDTSCSSVSCYVISFMVNKKYIFTFFLYFKRFRE